MSGGDIGRPEDDAITLRAEIGLAREDQRTPNSLRTIPKTRRPLAICSFPVVFPRLFTPPSYAGGRTILREGSLLSTEASAYVSGDTS